MAKIYTTMAQGTGMTQMTMEQMMRHQEMMERRQWRGL